LIVSKFGLGASILTTMCIMVSYLWLPESFPQNTDIFKVFFDAIIYGIVIIVVAVPEGLPLAVTLSLAFSLNKMREEKTVIKSIEACENMACVDTICTDYRGILTQCHIEVISIFIEEQTINESNVANLKYYASEDLYNFFCESIAVNTIAFSVRNKETGGEKYIGDPIECSLLRFLNSRLYVDYSFIRNNTLRPIIPPIIY
jgi:P-type E1-E2 ATPase